MADFRDFILIAAETLIAFTRTLRLKAEERKPPVSSTRPGLLAAILLAAIAATPAAAESVVLDRSVTEADVVEAQGVWCQALLDISKANDTGGQAAAKALAEKVIDTAYAYESGPVLFKPTLTVSPQTFRTTRDGALSYFVGGDPAYPNDKGFALKGWTDCKVKDEAILLLGDTATTMGKVEFTAKDGKVTTVDKTWQYVKDEDGNLRIVVHHSSLEYTAN